MVKQGCRCTKEQLVTGHFTTNLSIMADQTHLNILVVLSNDEAQFNMAILIVKPILKKWPTKFDYD